MKIKPLQTPALICVILLAGLTARGQDTFVGGRGSGGSITGSYVFNNQQFLLQNSTNVNLKSGALVTNLGTFGTLTNDGFTIYRTAFNTNPISTYVFLPTMTAAEITNAVGALPGDTLKWFTAGTYIIPTNSTTWAKSGVTNLFHFEPGAVIKFGHPANTSGSIAAPTALFHDQGGATTLIVTGTGDFVSSNLWGSVVHCVQSASRMEFEANNCIRALTNGAGAAVFYHQSGKLVVNVVSDVENYGYDGFWNDTGGGTVDFHAGRIYAGDSAIEYSSDAANPHRFDIGVIEKRVQVHNHPAFLVQADNVFIKAKVINLHSNAYIVSIGSGTFPGAIDAQMILCDDNNNRPLVNSGNGVHIKNAWMLGPGAITAVFPGTGAILENCTIRVGYSEGVLNVLDGNPGDVVTVLGSLSIPVGSVGSNIIVQGGTITRTNIIGLTADNQLVPTSGARHIRISSDNGTAGNRTMVLANRAGSGDEMTLEWVGSNAGELVDDSALSGGGNVRLNGTWTPAQYNTLLLQFNGTDWIERGRSTGSGTPGGSDTQVQVNNSGAFGGLSGITSPDKGTNLTVSGNTTSLVASITTRFINNGAYIFPRGGGDSLLDGSFADGSTKSTYGLTMLGNTTIHLTNFLSGSYMTIVFAMAGSGGHSLTLDSTNELLYINSTNNQTGTSITIPLTQMANGERGVFYLHKHDATQILIIGPFISPHERTVDLDNIAITDGWTGAGALVRSNAATINSVTNLGGYFGTGTNHALLMVMGTNGSGFGFQGRNASRTNLFIFDVVGMTAGQGFVLDNAVTAGPTNIYTITNATSGGSGDSVSVNGTGAVDADLDDATPAAPTGGLNVKWQKDGGTPNNVSAYVPTFARTSFVPVGWMEDGATAPDAIATYADTRKIDIRKFSNAADNILEFGWQIPVDAVDGSGTADFQLKWRPIYIITESTAPAANEGVTFGLAGASVADAEDFGATVGAEGDSEVANLNTAHTTGDIVYGPYTEITVTGGLAGEMGVFSLRRDTADAEDDYGQKVGLVGIEFKYTASLATTY